MTCLSRDRSREGGYALLLVYAMAATVAIMLYMQLPRVAFEAQRDKEQLLIDRGEQYSRAVQLFVRKFNRFPADVAALENTQTIRFLRRKYKDPMTGKEEWREVHVGPGGVFTDSLIYGPKKGGDKNAPQNFIAELAPAGGNPAGGEGVNVGTRRRASDQSGAPGDINNAGQTFPGSNGAALGNGQTSPINGPVMVLPDGRIVPVSSTGQPLIPQQPPGPGRGFGIPGVPGQPDQANPQGQFPPGFQPPPGNQIVPGFQPNPGNGPPGPGQPLQNGLPPGFPNPPPAAAADLINQILTTPRPGGLNGNGNAGTSAGQGLGGQTIGGGFAGVASKAEAEGIKIYKEHTAYNEWEFVYDMTKDASRGGGGRGGVPQPLPPGAVPPPAK